MFSLQTLLRYCAGGGGTTAQPPLASLTRVAVADWMDVSAAILGKVLIDSGVRTQSGSPFNLVAVIHGVLRGV